MLALSINHRRGARGPRTKPQNAEPAGAELAWAGERELSWRTNLSPTCSSRVLRQALSRRTRLAYSCTRESRRRSGSERGERAESALTSSRRLLASRLVLSLEQPQVIILALCKHDRPMSMTRLRRRRRGEGKRAGTRAGGGSDRRVLKEGGDGYNRSTAQVGTKETEREIYTQRGRLRLGSRSARARRTRARPPLLPARELDPDALDALLVDWVRAKKALGRSRRVRADRVGVRVGARGG